MADEQEGIEEMIEKPLGEMVVTRTIRDARKQSAVAKFTINLIVLDNCKVAIA